MGLHGVKETLYERWFAKNFLFHGARIDAARGEAPG